MPSEPVHDPFDREDAPFLRSSDSDSPPNSPLDEPKHHESQTRDPTSQKLRLRLLLTLFAVVLAVEMGLAMAESPMVRIYESIVCRNYYTQQDPSQIDADGQVEEELCKVKDVQTELAAVKGYMEFFDGLSSMVFLVLPGSLLAISWLLTCCLQASSLRSLMDCWRTGTDESQPSASVSLALS